MVSLIAKDNGFEFLVQRPTDIYKGQPFDGEDGCTLYVTLGDQGNLESFRVNIPGREWKMLRNKK